MKKMIFTVVFVLGLTGCGNKDVGNENLVGINQDENTGINVVTQSNSVAKENEELDIVEVEKSKDTEILITEKEEKKEEKNISEKDDDKIINTGEQKSSLDQELKNTEEPKDIEEVYEIGVETGKKAINFEVELLTGEKVKLSDYLGKVVFLNFWATWCGPCVGELPDIEKIKNEYGDRLIVLAVNGGEEKDDIKTFIDRKGYTFNVGIDEAGNLLNTYDSMFIPLSIFIDENGVIKERKVGALSEIEMRNIIDSFIKNK